MSVEVKNTMLGRLGVSLDVKLITLLTNVPFYDKEDIKAFTKITPKSIPTLSLLIRKYR